VLTLVRRALLVALVAAAALGNVTTCAGWLSSPEARMACCENEAICPMHKGGPAADSASGHRSTQPEADSCCARSEDGGSSAPSSPIATVPPAVADSASVPVSTNTDFRTRAAAPCRRQAHVALHLLLTVIVV
jgi:hypothetical protein